MLKRKMLSSLLISLLISQTSLAALQEPEKILKKGEKAPYVGVLVPEIRYREYSDFEIDSRALQDCLNREQPAPSINLTALEKAKHILYGVLVGIVITTVARGR